MAHIQSNSNSSCRSNPLPTGNTTAETIETPDVSSRHSQPIPANIDNRAPPNTSSLQRIFIVEDSPRISARLKENIRAPTTTSTTHTSNVTTTTHTGKESLLTTNSSINPTSPWSPSLPEDQDKRKLSDVPVEDHEEARSSAQPDQALNAEKIEFTNRITALSIAHSRHYPSDWVLYTPLQREIILGDAGRCRKLINAGINANDGGEIGRSPLMLALGNDDIVNILFPLSDASSQTTMLSFVFMNAQFATWERLSTSADKVARLMFFVFLSKMEDDEFEVLFDQAPLETQKIFFRVLSKITSWNSKNNQAIGEIFHRSFERSSSEIRANPEFIGIRAEMEKRGPEFIKELTICNLFGHRFSLRGEQFEGLNYKQTLEVWDLIATSLQSALNQETRFLKSSQKMISWTMETLIAKKDNPEVLSWRSVEKTSIVPCGWKGHAVVALFSKKILVKINTAQGESNDTNGMAFYLINNKDIGVRTNVIKTLIRNKIDDVPPIVGLEYFTDVVSSQLDADLVALIPFRQDSNNCGWSSSKFAALATFILYDLEAKQKEFCKENIAQSFKDVALIFDEWDLMDRSMSTAAAVPILKKYPILFNLERLKEQISNWFEPGNIGLLHQLTE